MLSWCITNNAYSISRFIDALYVAERRVANLNEIP